MPQTHVPVLAGELIEALDPQPGQVAIDCTFGAGGHARLVAERLGGARALLAIDRDPVAEAIPAPARFAGGHPAKRTFQAIRIAVNGELAQLDAALPLAWDRLRVGGRLAAISFQSLEDRRVKHFLADRARGCICPPDLPVCGCGRTPEAELVHRRSIVPTPGEVAANPRAKSARLRAARKLREEPA